ncbi:hypothetical protein [Brucella intermedia]|uniref:hypothetical protein n=1 Tax=Brucella intermedia TaxID=94625 RepID=UPI00224A6C88|nr:hypothetical protein [Brucella intermedia]
MGRLAEGSNQPGVEVVKSLWKIAHFGDDVDEATPVFIPLSAKATSTCILDVTGLTEDQGTALPLRSCPRNGLRGFLPLAAAPPFLASQESRSQPPSTSFQPFGCGSIALGPTTVIEVAMGAARPTKE